MVKQGDIIVIDLDPTKGHEQAGYRPAVVTNNALHTKNSNMVLICPITNSNRESVLHVKLEKTATTGYILCDHIRSVDLSDRKFRKVDELYYDTLWDVCDILKGMADVLHKPTAKGC